MARIIIVEDDPMIAEIYQKKFEGAGFEVLLADTGEQVLSLAKKEKVDVILLDLILPRMSGFDVLQELKQTIRCSAKVIIFSNLNQQEDREKALKLGADGFIVKADFAPSDLVKEIARLMNQYQEEEKNEVKNGNGNGGNNVSLDKETGTRKILMMEDEEVFRDMFGEKLKQDGFDVTFALDGSHGLKEALEGNYALFIVDMVMPNITGDEIISKLKLEDKTKDIPIIILSASVEEETKRQVEAMGIEAFFSKTQIVPSELSKKVGEILNK